MKSNWIRAALIAFVFMASAGFSQEQQIKWRQISVGDYSVRWPSVQGGENTCLVNDGTGSMSWQVCQATGGAITKLALGDGSPSEPSLSFVNAPTVGWFRSMDGHWVHQAKYGGLYYNYADLNGFNGLDGGIRLRRGEDGAGTGKQNWIRSTAYDGVTAVDLRLRASKIYVAAEGGVDWYLPVTAGSANQCLIANASGGSAWGACASGAVLPDPLRLQDGTYAAPTYSFANNNNAGMFRTASGVGIAAMWNTGYLRVDGSGSSYSPRISLVSQSYGAGATYWGWLRVEESDGSLSGLYIDATQIRLNSDGAYYSPILSFASDPYIGLYKPAAGAIALTPGQNNGLVQFDNQATYVPRMTFIRHSNGGTPFAHIRVTDQAATPATGILVLDTIQNRANADGTVTAPAFSFSNDGLMGMYRAGAASLGLTTGNWSGGGWWRFDNPASYNPRLTGLRYSNGGLWSFTIRAEDGAGAASGYITFDSAQVRSLGDGSATTPAYSFSNAGSMGMFRMGTDKLGWSNNIGSAGSSMRLDNAGSYLPRLTLISNTYGGSYYSTIRAEESTGGLDPLVMDCTYLQANGYITGTYLYMPDGTTALPTHSFLNDNAMGMYRHAANYLGLVAGGSRTLVTTVSTRNQINLHGNYTATAGTNYNVIRSEDNAATPVLQDVYFDANQVLVTDGLQTEPSYSFLNDKLMGIYRSATNTMAFKIGTGANMRLTDGGTYKARLNMYSFNAVAGGTDYAIIGSYDATGTPVQQGLWLDANLVDIRNAAGTLKINGTQVVTVRQTAVADVTGTAGATYTATEQALVNSLKTQLNLLLARMRTHGLIAP